MLRRRGISIVHGTIIGATVLLLLVHPRVLAEARATSVHSDMTVQADGSVAVIETIRIQFDGRSSGIRQRFSLRYAGPDGRRYAPRIRSIRVNRSGKEGEDLRSIGSSSSSLAFDTGLHSGKLPPGEYTYTIAYQVEQPFSFTGDRDALYWSILGDAWRIPVDAMSATVRFPASIPADDLTPRTHIIQGKRAVGEGVAEIEEPGVVTFAAGRALAPGETVALSVDFPKGVVRGIPERLRLWRRFQETAGLNVIWFGVAAVLLYYLFVWMRVGRDPVRGPIRPREEPPAKVSPAALRVLWRMQFDAKAFAAAILHMAVQGHVAIQERDGVYRLVRQARETEPLAREELIAKAAIFQDGGKRALDAISNPMAKARIACAQSLKSDLEKVYFLLNTKWFLPGIVVSILAAVLGVLCSPEASPIALFLALWLTGWTAGLSALTKSAVADWQFYRAGKRGGLKAVLVGLGCPLPWWMAEIGGALCLLTMLSASLVLGILMIAAMGFVFRRLLRAPTRLGRQTLDEIEGFRAFLGSPTPIGDAGNPRSAAALFYRYLPHAFALDCGAAWTARFAAVWTAAAASADDALALRRGMRVTAGVHPTWLDSPNAWPTRLPMSCGLHRPRR